MENPVSLFRDCSPFAKLKDNFLFRGQQQDSQLFPKTMCKFLTSKSVCNGNKVILIEIEQYFQSMTEVFQVK